MELLQRIVFFVLSVSFLTFVAFFGRLPTFRNTPIGFLHRVLWIHFPNGVQTLDRRLTGGTTWGAMTNLGNYLFYSKHPIVMSFFLGLITGSVYLFVPAVWPLISAAQKAIIPFIVPLPYIFTYLSNRSGHDAPHLIRADNAPSHLRHYPYDEVLFYPDQYCRTCNFVKPARSKHCSLCKSCVARADHHCVWVNNCLGRGNYKFFLLLLLTTSIVLAYGSYLFFSALRTPVNAYLSHRASLAAPRTHARSENWFLDLFDVLIDRLSAALRIGGLPITGVGLLATLTAPLPFGLFLYHIYLIWAGMTTNESGKWSDLKDDMGDGLVFMRMSPENEQRFAGDTLNDDTDWPIESRQFVSRTDDGKPPAAQTEDARGDPGTTRWKQVWSLSQIENIYDLGFWDNLVEVLQN